jgi:hypothetical protein
MTMLNEFAMQIDVMKRYMKAWAVAATAIGPPGVTPLLQ